MKPTVQIVPNGSYKIGVDEVPGLRDALVQAFKPVRTELQDRVYWNDLKFEALEYKSRDGFIPHSHNNGGVALDLVIPSCESYSFPFLEFGECDGCNHDCSACTATENSSGECASQVDGHLDARLRIILKFEGFDDDGRMQFYVNACGGNGDAPYFRIGNLADLYEGEFTARTLKGIKRAASKHVRALLKVLKGDR